MERKYALYNEVQQFGTEASFIANVIINGCGKPTAKLQGLVNLLKRGTEVRTAQFDMFTLYINGEKSGYQALERFAKKAYNETTKYYASR